MCKNFTLILLGTSIFCIMVGVFGGLSAIITFEKSEPISVYVVDYTHPTSKEHNNLFSPIFEIGLNDKANRYTSIISSNEKYYAIGQKVSIIVYDENMKLAQIASLGNFVGIWIFVFSYGIIGLAICVGMSILRRVFKGFCQEVLH